MKIALLAPAGAMHRYNGDFHKNLHYAPITLALLAAMVPKELNAEVKIYDETAEAIPLDLDADVVGIEGEYIEAELLSLFAKGYKRLGIDIIIKYNSR